jgi:hypothetical protein
LKEDIIDAGIMAFKADKDQRQPFRFFLKYIETMHLESKNYDIKKINLAEELRISPEEPIEKLMGVFMMNNFNQSFVSKNILNLERWDYVCKRCDHKYTKYYEGIYFPLTCKVENLDADYEGEMKTLNNLMDYKYGFIDGV